MLATETRPVLAGVPDPFPGLRPFETIEESIFRGRQLHTDELLRRLASHRFLAVVGTSGSGKSSLVRAGLLPALDRGYLVGATSRWRVAVVRPGMAPIENLVEALRSKDALGVADSAQVRSTSLGLVEAVRDARLTAGESLLVVADQFEEVFRYQRRMMDVDGGADAALFVRLLLTAARRPDAPVYVVLTMRSDFLGDCSQFSGLPEALSESQYLISRLTRDQRRQAIEEPLRLFGAAMTPQLIEELLNDSGAETDDATDGSRYRGSAPDPLPVLQHALMRTYFHWKSLPPDQAGERIDLPQYRDSGRMESALDQHAEAVYNDILDDQGRRWAERVFRCLTTTELGQPIRRPTPLEELYAVIGARDHERAKVDEVLAIFRRRENSFLHLSNEKTVDISHESLIWKWRRLGRWVRLEAAGGELYRDLIRDSQKETTWGEPKLSSALARRDQEDWNPAWARQYSDGPFSHANAFLERSRQAVRNQTWLRRSAMAAALALVILAIWTSSREKELASVRGVRDRYASELDANREEQGRLGGQIAELEARAERIGATQAERDQIAREMIPLQDQLKKSQDETGRLSAAVQQATTLQASIESLQSRLEQSQRDLTLESSARRNAEAESSVLRADVAALDKDLENARSPRGLEAGAAIVAAYRQLTRDHPGQYRATLATALQVNGLLYQTTKRVKEAEAAYSESLVIRRELAKEGPAMYLPSVAETLTGLGDLFWSTRRFKEAEAAFSEALRIRREFSANSRGTYLLEIADTLMGLGWVYMDTQRTDNAAAAFSEAGAIQRQLVRDNPVTARSDLAMSLTYLGAAHEGAKRLKEAETAYVESIRLWTDLAEESPAVHLPSLARALNNIAAVYRLTDRRKEQEQALTTSLRAYRLLATKSSPELPDMSLTLSNLGKLYAETLRPKEAVAAFSEAISIRRELAEANPTGYSDALADNLLDLAVVLGLDGGGSARSCSLVTEASQVALSEAARKRASSWRQKLCSANTSG